MISLETSPLLSDETATPEERALCAEAMRDRSVQFAAQRVVDALHALVDEVVFDDALRGAVLAALKGHGRLEGVRGNLRGAELELIGRLAEAKDQRRVYMAKLEARRLEVMPMLNRVTRELLDLAEQAKTVERRVAGFERSREANREHLKAAGYTDSEITAMDLKPTPADRAQWLQGLERMRRREAQTNAFLRTSPHYDESILAGLEARA